MEPQAIKQFRGKYRWLSNFWRLKDGLTVEHYYQASKALYPNQYYWVLEAPTPGDAKARGRRVTIRPDWEAVKVSVMRDLLRMKFADPELRQRLIETGNALLEEGNTWGDREWGTVDGVGNNLLGKLLMEIREEVAHGNEGPSQPV